MARKPRKQRDELQRVRQQALRDKAKAHKKPSRDDIARTALWMWIRNTWRVDASARQTFDMMRDDLTDQLEQQGFEPQACGDEFERLLKAYNTDQPPFRIKRHLQDPPPEGLI